MANGDDQVQLDILIDIRDAIKALDTFEKKGEEVADKTTSAFDAIKGAAAVAVAVFGSAQIINFFESGIDAAIKQESAMAALEQQLILTGDASTQALDEFKSLADELESSTGIADDVILQQAAIAKSFGITNDQAKDLVKAATELSAVTGKDLESSVRTLGKTFSGIAGPLDDQIAGFDKLTKKQLANGEAIQLVLDRYGGSAAARMDTFAGAILGVENAFGNLQEAFGEAIVQSPVLVSALQEITGALQTSQALVSENTGGLDSLLVAAVEVSNQFAQGFLGSIEIVNSALEFFTRILGGIPLLLAGAGTNAIAGAVESVTGVLAGFGLVTKETADGITGNFKKVAADVNAVDGEIEKFFDNTALGSDTLQRKIQASTDRIVAADGKTAKSAKDASQKRAVAARDSAKSATDLAKTIEEADKLRLEVSRLNQTAIDAEISKRDELLAKIQKNNDAGGLGDIEAANLRIATINATGDKILAIEQENYDKSVAKAAEAAAKVRAAVERTIADPLTFIFNKLPDVDASDIFGDSLGSVFTEAGKDIADGLRANSKGIAAGIGIASSVLDGAEGAKKLLGEGAGLVADSFFPGSGNAVAALTEQLAAGPEANKAMVKGFVEAIPDIITAIAESVPVIVEALVDSLINEGGIVKIAIALARALAGEAIFKAIGEQIGLEFGDAFNASNIGGTISDGFTEGVDILADGIEGIPRGFKKGADELSASIKDGLSDALGPLTDGFAQAGAILNDTLSAPIAAFELLGQAFIPFTEGVTAFVGAITSFDTTVSSVPAVFTEAGTAITSAIANGFTAGKQRIAEAGTELAAKIGGSIDAGAAKVREAISGVGENISNAFSAPLATLTSFPQKLAGLFSPLTRAADILDDAFDPLTRTPSWVRRLEDFIDNLFSFELPGSDFASGGFDGDPSTPLATGGIVPAGFPNDSFRSNLTSGERVVSVQQNRDLTSFLDSANAAGGSGQNMDQVVALLSVIASQMASGDQSQTVNVQIDGSTLAKAMLNVSRRNLRTA
jgi:hypothetical protein